MQSTTSEEDAISCESARRFSVSSIVLLEASCTILKASDIFTLNLFISLAIISNSSWLFISSSSVKSPSAIFLKLSLILLTLLDNFFEKKMLIPIDKTIMITDAIITSNKILFFILTNPDTSMSIPIIAIIFPLESFIGAYADIKVPKSSFIGFLFTDTCPLKASFISSSNGYSSPISSELTIDPSTIK
ncbi:hypothetical protein SDC9_106614 [bioreactor metagenome]|uniref:Uncharacterized protein n=1 Tax=bioreactor metagenome TaxID=1076179 RepID=A0A645B401_9ZZZZ